MASNTVEIILTALDKSFSKTVLKGQKRLKDLGEEVNRTRQHFGGLKTTIVGLLGGVSLGALATSIWQAGVNAQGLEKSFKAIAGSAEQSRKEIEFLESVSDVLGLDFVSSANAFKQISAAAKGTAVEGRTVKEVFVGISEAATVLDLNAEAVEGSLLAISQMISKGKVSAEELRGQLGERLPGAFQIAAKAMNVTTAELDEMLSQGKVMAEDLLPKLAKALHEQYGDAARESSDGAVQALNRFQNAWYEIRDTVASSGFLERVTQYLESMAETMRDPRAINTLRDLANTLITFVDLAVRGALGLKGIFEAVAAATLLISGGIFKVGQAVGWLTDQLKLTKGAADEWKQSAEAAFGAAGELIEKSSDSFAGMKGGLKQASRGYKDIGKEAGLTFDGIASNAKATADTQEKATGEALAEMKRQYKEYADSIKRIQDQIAGREQSLAEQLRAMARSGMTDLGAWQDRKKEAQEYEAAAKKAAAAGDYDQAVKMADKARAAYADLNTEVETNGKTLISQEQGLQTAMAGVQRAGELAVDILEQQKDAADAAADALNERQDWSLGEAFTEAGRQAKELNDTITDSGGNWGKVWADMESDAKTAIDATEQRIVKLTRDREVNIYVNEVIRRAAGGMIQRFATGGKLGGYGGGDRIPALLEAGEFIIRKEAVRRFGAGIFHALNSLRLPELPRFATGGPVQMTAGAGAAGGDSRPVFFNMPSGRTVGPFQGSGRTIKSFERELDDMAWGRS